MSSVKNFLSNIFNFFTKTESETENDVVEIVSPISVKRRTDENFCDGSTVKKKKLNFSPFEKDAFDPCTTSYLLKKPFGEFQKENQFMASNNSESLKQKSRQVDHREVYCLDDEDSKFHNESNDVFPRKGINRKNPSTKLSEIDDCIIIGETHPTTSSSVSDSRSNFFLNKVHEIREQNTYITMVKNQCPSMRSSTPLMNSTIHNTKQNRSGPNNIFSNRSFSFQTRNIFSPKISSLSHDSSIKSSESIFDKVVIDLTSNEDDEDQRQSIQHRVICSPEIQNMKSSFIAEESFVLDEDLISTLTKKYDSKLAKMKIRASKFEKAVHDRRGEITKVISEILEKRLSLKEDEEEKEDLQQKPSTELAPITKDMFSEINSILSSKKSPLVQIKDTSVKLQDIRTLENTSWLNDEVINAYMNLIKLRYEERPDQYPKVHCFNTFLYEQLNKKGYASVKRWTRKIDIFDFKILIIPIHLGNHWCLVQIRFAEKIIYYYDSMGSPNNRCLNIMLQYLEEEYLDKKNEHYDITEWKLINVPTDELPQQRNAHDCGVFACTFAEHITRNALFNFDQDDMPYFRVKMMYEILTGKLIL